MPEHETGENGRHRTRVDGLHQLIAIAMKQARAARGWRQQDLVDQLQEAAKDWGGATWTNGAVAAVEAGRRRVDLNELPALCWVLGLPLERLLTSSPYLEYVPFDDSDFKLSVHDVTGALFGFEEPGDESTVHIDVNTMLAEIDEIQARLRALTQAPRS